MTLRWMQPAGSAPVDWWRIYRDDVLIVDGLFPDPVDGVYEAGVPSWPYEASYQMTAVNAAGESAQSNVVRLPDLPTPVGLLLLIPLLLLLRRNSGVR